MKKIKIPKMEIRHLQRTLPQLGKPFGLLWCDVKDVSKGKKANPVAWGWISQDLLDFINTAPKSLKVTMEATGQCVVKMQPWEKNK